MGLNSSQLEDKYVLTEADKEQWLAERGFSSASSDISKIKDGTNGFGGTQFGSESEEFLGTWVSIKCEGLKEFCKALGYSWLTRLFVPSSINKRNITTKTGPNSFRSEITQSTGNWSETVTYNFEIGKPVQNPQKGCGMMLVTWSDKGLRMETTMNGKPCMITSEAITADQVKETCTITEKDGTKVSLMFTLQRQSV